MRYEKIDYIKGFLIIVMILFHFNYVLQNIFYLGTGISPVFLRFVQILWWGMFIWLSGLCFAISLKKHWDDISKVYLKKIVILALISIMISLVTYYFINSEFIVFWIIHFFTLWFLFLLFFRKFRYYNFPIWILFIIIWNIIWNMVFWIKFLFWLWLTYDWFYSADYYAILPWFWVMLLWYSLWLLLIEKDLMGKVFSGKIKYFWSLEFLGRYSLVIYIIHVPIIYFGLKLFI